MDGPILSVKFFRSESGNEPVKEFLRAMGVQDRKSIGTDIKEVQFGWPLGMPLVRKIEKDLWELRCKVSNGIVRILFTVCASNMLLLHAFVKKTPKLPLTDRNIARTRLRLFRNPHEQTHRQ